MWYSESRTKARPPIRRRRFLLEWPVSLAQPNLIRCCYLHALALLLKRALFRINKLQTLFSLFAASGPLFSIVYRLFCQKWGVGGSHQEAKGRSLVTKGFDRVQLCRLHCRHPPA